MSEYNQIQCHLKCLCRQCRAQHWGKLWFHIKGIGRALRSVGAELAYLMFCLCLGWLLDATFSFGAMGAVCLVIVKLCGIN